MTLVGVASLIGGQVILQDINWQIAPGENWVVIGPNGGGKSTLIAIAGLRRHPSAGQVTVLGHRLGYVDIRPLRSKISTSSAIFATSLRPALSVLDVVKCGMSGVLEPWWYDEAPGDHKRALNLLDSVGLQGHGDQSFGTLSSGEKQRCLLARALMPDPDLLLLDEPNAGLDLAGREQLIASLDQLANTTTSVADTQGTGTQRATVLVTHHVEDIPRSASHLLAIAKGRIMEAGPIEETLSAGLLSDLFELPVRLSREDQRWSARLQMPRPSP